MRGMLRLGSGVVDGRELGLVGEWEGRGGVNEWDIIDYFYSF